MNAMQYDENCTEVLTVDLVKTKAKIMERHGTLMYFIRDRLRYHSSTTLYHILNGRLPYTVRPNSRYQELLRKLRAEGLLVELSPEKQKRKRAAKRPAAVQNDC
jgi:hypothetical protein